MEGVGLRVKNEGWGVKGGGCIINLFIIIINDLFHSNMKLIIS